jgi:hypothetical protein
MIEKPQKGHHYKHKNVDGVNIQRTLQKENGVCTTFIWLRIKTNGVFL